MPETPYVPERRPIASRERKTSQRIARWLVQHEVSPNAISVFGMVAGIAAGGAFAVTCVGGFQRPAFVAAALLMQLRLLANMFDGMVAVESQTASPVGELFNEVPDRIADAAIFIGAGYAAGADLVLGYVAASTAMFVAYVRAQGVVAGAHQEFCGPMAKPQRMLALTTIAFYCGLAPNQWQPSLAAAPEWGLMAAGLMMIIVGMVWTAARRLRRIAKALGDSNS